MDLEISLQILKIMVPLPHQKYCHLQDIFDASKKIPQILISYFFLDSDVVQFQKQ
jgi:hypothetical protein